MRLGFAEMYVLISVAACASSATSRSRDVPADAGEAAAGRGGDSLADASDGRSGNGLDCEEYARALCDRFTVCGPGQLDEHYGNLANCKSRVSLACSVRVAAPGALASVGASCPAVTAALSCEQFFGGEVGCQLKGTLQPGQACLYGQQCASGACLTSTSPSGCGRCVEPVSENGDCSSAPCAGGLLCNASRCTRLRGKDESCDTASIACNPYLACIDGTCRAPIALGSPCATPSECGPLSRAQCLLNAAGMSVCTQAKFVQPGQPCGTGDPCAGLGSCLQGNCVPRPIEGQPCNGFCQYPATCQNGTCRLPDPASCG